MAWLRLHDQRGADAGRPLSHAEQPVGVEAAGPPDREAATVVGDVEPGAAGITRPGDRGVASLGVALDVDDRLLGDAEDLALLRQRQPNPFDRAQRDLELGPLADPVDEELERLAGSSGPR